MIAFVSSAMVPVAGAALALTVTTLAVVRKNRFVSDFITDRAAGASTLVSVTHDSHPLRECVEQQNVADMERDWHSLPATSIFARLQSAPLQSRH